ADAPAAVATTRKTPNDAARETFRHIFATSEQRSSVLTEFRVVVSAFTRNMLAAATPSLTPELDGCSSRSIARIGVQLAQHALSVVAPDKRRIRGERALQLLARMSRRSGFPVRVGKVIAIDRIVGLRFDVLRQQRQRLAK